MEDTATTGIGDEYLSDKDKAKIQRYKDDWAADMAKGDTRAAEADHINAQAVRAANGYLGDASGAHFTPYSASMGTAGIPETQSTSGSSGRQTYKGLTGQAAIQAARADNSKDESGGSYAGNNYSSYINDLYNAQYNAQVAALDSAYQNNVASLDAAEKKIEPTYYAAKNQTAANTTQAQQAWNERAAASGLNSGASGQAALSRNNAYQQAMTDIGTAEADAHADLNLQRQKLASEYSAAINQARAENDASKAQALYSEWVRQDEIARQREQIEYQREQDAKTEYANTISAYYDNYMAEIQKLQNDGDPSNDWKIPYLQAARNQKQANQAAAEASAAQTEYERALDLWKTSGAASSYVSAILGGPVGARTADYNVDYRNDGAGTDAADTTESISNQHGNTWVYVPGYGRLSWSELESYVNSGAIKETASNGVYTYRKA